MEIVPRRNQMTSLFDLFRSHSDAIGFWAAFLTTVSFVPQVIEAWHTGGEGLSWIMLILFTTGVGLWFFYGVLLASIPLMTANGITGLQILIILVVKIRYSVRSL